MEVKSNFKLGCLLILEGWEEEYGWTESIVQDFIRRDGFEDIDILMRRMSLNIPGYSEIMGRQMIYTRQEGGCLST